VLWGSPSTRFGARGTCLGFQINEVSSLADNLNSSTQKLHVDMDGTNPVRSAIAFGELVYMGLAFKVATAPPLGGSTLIAQLWQGAPFTPPVSVHLVNDSSAGLHLKMVVANEQTGTNPSAEKLSFGPGRVTVGRWYKLVLGARANHKGMAGEGWATASLADCGSSNWTAGYTQFGYYAGDVGLDPQDFGNYSSTNTDKPNPQLRPSFGLYHSYTASPVKVMFDEIRLTGTFDSADPGSHPK
jgi:hypothetical protein